ncbi:Pentatricopeptide repeat-containing protein At2g36730 [Linum perenne]
MHGSSPAQAPINSVFFSKKHRLLALLKLCSSIKHLYQIHAQVHVSGLQRDAFLSTELIRVCSLSPWKNLNHARTVLRSSIKPAPPTSWNLLIRGYSSSDNPREGIIFFRGMQREGISTNKLTFPFVLNSCASCLALKEGEQVHVHVIKSGLDSDVYICNNLIHLYGSCKRVYCARKVFDEMAERTVVSWNAVITACVGCSLAADAAQYFAKMKDSGFEPDEATMVVMLSLSAEVGNLGLGRWIHSQVIKERMELSYQLGTAIVDMYAKGGNLRYAMSVFRTMEKKNVWTWSAMILGMAQHGFAKEGLELFRQMLETSSIRPNYVTFLGVLCACSHAGLVEDGFRYFHEMEHRYGIKPTVVHYGAMVDILARAGHLKEAYEFTISMPHRNDPTVLRTLLGACSNRGENDEDEVADKVRKRLLEVEPRRSGNLVMVANMYADAGMWQRVADVRKVMRDGGLKTRGGESCLELDGSIHRFFSGCDSQDHPESLYQFLAALDLHIKTVSFD